MGNLFHFFLVMELNESQYLFSQQQFVTICNAMIRLNYVHCVESQARTNDS